MIVVGLIRLKIVKLYPETCWESVIMKILLYFTTIKVVWSLKKFLKDEKDSDEINHSNWKII
jgi:uncharacterized membrane protein YqjE